MVFKIINHPEWSNGRYRITVANDEIRVKYNDDISIEDAKIIEELAYLAQQKRSELGIHVTVRSWDNNVVDTTPVLFYTLVAGKKTTLFSVERKV